MSEKTCFIISPIGSKDEGTWSRWDKVRRHLIEEVAAKKGYEVIRADDISKPGIITSQIIEYLLSSELVIADLSTKNANVFYELAIRDAARLPVVLIGDTTLEIPFDVRPQRMIKYSLDPDELAEARTKLGEYIDSVEDETFKVDSPVTNAILKPSDEISASSEEYLKLILDKLSNIGMDVREEKIKRVIELPSVQSWESIREFRPNIKLSHRKATPGTLVTISGFAWAPDNVVDLSIDAPGEHRWVIGTGPSGAFSRTWIVPDVEKKIYKVHLKSGDYIVETDFEVI